MDKFIERVMQQDPFVGFTIFIVGFCMGTLVKHLLARSLNKQQSELRINEKLSDFRRDADLELFKKVTILLDNGFKIEQLSFCFDKRMNDSPMIPFRNFTFSFSGPEISFHNSEVNCSFDILRESIGDLYNAYAHAYSWDLEQGDEKLVRKIYNKSNDKVFNEMKMAVHNIELQYPEFVKLARNKLGC